MMCLQNLCSTHAFNVVLRQYATNDLSVELTTRDNSSAASNDTEHVSLRLDHSHATFICSTLLVSKQVMNVIIKDLHDDRNELRGATVSNERIV